MSTKSFFFGGVETEFEDLVGMLIPINITWIKDLKKEFERHLLREKKVVHEYLWKCHSVRGSSRPQHECSMPLLEHGLNLPFGKHPVGPLRALETERLIRVAISPQNAQALRSQSVLHDAESRLSERCIPELLYTFYSHPASLSIICFSQGNLNFMLGKRVAWNCRAKKWKKLNDFIVFQFFRKFCIILLS